MARSLETKVTFLADAKQLLATTKNIDRNLSGLGGSFAKLGKFAKLGGITFGITKVIGFLKQSVVAANDTAKAQARLDQIFRNSGNKSLALFKELSKEARKISINIGLDDKAVIEVQERLAVYLDAFANQGAEGTKKFNEATRLAFDIDAAGLATATSAVETIGKVLLVPQEAAARLKKLGIALTNEEIDSINELIKQGKLAEAQTVILDAISKRVGGVAEANASNLDKFNVAWGSIKETIGGLILPVLAPLAAALGFAADQTTKFTSEGGFLSKALETGKGFVDKFKGGISNLNDSTELATASTFAANSIVGTLQTTFKNIKSSQTFKDGLDKIKKSGDDLYDSMKDVGDILKTNVIPTFTFLTNVTIVALGAALVVAFNGVTSLLDKVTGTVKGVLDMIANTNEALLLMKNGVGFKEAIKIAFEPIPKPNVDLLASATLRGRNAASNAAKGAGDDSTDGTNITSPTTLDEYLKSLGLGTGASKSATDGATVVKELDSSIQELSKNIKHADSYTQTLFPTITQPQVDMQPRNENTGDAIDRLTRITEALAAGTATVTNNYQISVETLVPTAQTGKTIVDAIQQFESRSGSSGRFSAVVMA